jgi:uncharacterized membrane protein
MQSLSAPPRAGKGAEAIPVAWTLTHAFATLTHSQSRRERVECRHANNEGRDDPDPHHPGRRVSTLQAISLLGATLTMGLVAGVFALYAHTIMPALKQTDDRTFVAAFQSIDRAIINPWFMASAFIGALVLTLAAALASLGEDSLPWIIAALVFYLITVAITASVNLPLNDAIKAAGDPGRIADLAGVRERFDESRWAAWNLVRVATSTGAFACLAWALVLYGRSTA